MKLFYIFIIFIIFPIFNLFPQGIFMDTIKINKNNAATLEFPEPVLFSLISNNPYRLIADDVKEYKFYQISEVGNVLIIEAVKDNINPVPSSFSVKTSSSTYYGYVCYSDNVTKSFFPFLPLPDETKKNPSIITLDGTEVFKTSQTDIPEDSIISRIHSVMAMANDFSDILDIKGNVIFQVASIVNDLKYSYIKLIIQNNSSSTYSVNGVVFRFEEGKKGLLKKKDVVNTEWPNPVKIIYPENKNIESYSYQNIGIAVPLFSGTDGELLLKIMETNGTRTAVINISSEDINSTKVF